VFDLLIMDYCDVVWMPSSAMHFKQLGRIYSKFSNLRSTACSSVTITLTERQCYHTAIQVYRSLHKIAPSYLHDTFNYAVDITGRVARNAHCLFVSRVRTTLAKNSFYFCRTRVWNSPFMEQRNWSALNSYIIIFVVAFV